MGKTGGKSGAELVPQEHGGAIHQGASENPVAGPGRPASAIREHCRGSFAQRVSILEDIADGKPLPQTVHYKGDTMKLDVSASIKERVQAIDTLAKYGGVDKLALTAEEQPEQVMTPERVAQMWEALQRVKTMRELEKMLIGAAKDQAE